MTLDLTIKKLARMQRNRESAAMSRDRRKKEREELLLELKELREENEKLTQANQHLGREMQQLCMMFVPSELTRQFISKAMTDLPSAT